MVESMCMDCKIRIKNAEIRIDLILLELYELDIILGIDFLTKYQAILDCSNKEVAMKGLGRCEVKFVGNKKVEIANIILVFKAKKLLKKGHTAY